MINTVSTIINRIKYKKLTYNFIDIPESKINFQSYEEIESSIQQFQNAEKIGKDESNQYDMYCLHFGTKGKPVIAILAGVHGTEWQSVIYSLNFFTNFNGEEWGNNHFLNYLRNNFHIIYIPAGNPWGVANTGPNSRFKGRNNSKKVNINRDFHTFSQKETQNIKYTLDTYQPFFFIDLHLMASRNDGGQNHNNIIIGNVDPESDHYRQYISDSLSKISTLNVDQWGDTHNSNHPGLSRKYLQNKTNPYTSETYSFIFELYRPVKTRFGVKEPLSSKQINEFGQLGLYFFLKAAVSFYLNSRRKQIFMNFLKL